MTRLSPTPFTISQLESLLAQIDANIAELMRDGKLAAAKYSSPGATGQSVDRSSNLAQLLAARQLYAAELQKQQPECWAVSRSQTDNESL